MKNKVAALAAALMMVALPAMAYGESGIHQHVPAISCPSGQQVKFLITTNGESGRVRIYFRYNLSDNYIYDYAFWPVNGQTNYYKTPAFYTEDIYGNVFSDIEQNAGWTVKEAGNVVLTGMQRYCG